ncbi:transposase [Ancylostoma caninum]|uniref:Transposase n=1 Tax=Ancylostoma caninum TaxID=29170 RepID=A0A368G4K1_ANCCA|nr:transposase [Ancylostoma caninum]
MDGKDTQLGSKTSKPVKETVDPSSLDEYSPLFHNEKDEKPPICEGISAMDLIEGVEPTEDFTEESSSGNGQEKSTTDPQENSEEPRNVMQTDEKDPFISKPDDNLPSTSTELFLHTNSEIKVEMEDEDEISEESAEENRTPPRDEESIIKSLMEADPTKSISELARELKISSKAVVSYLHNSNTSTEKEVGRWVPDERTLQCRVEICSSLLLRNIRDPFLDRIVVYAEKWIYFENRKRATVWLDDAVPICSESAGAQNGEKVFLTMWWTSIGMIHYHFVQGGKPMAEDKFPRQITNMYKKLECKQPGLVSELDVKGLFLLCDNPRPYTSLKSTVKLHQYRFEVLPHPPQSPDLLPSNYHVFRHLNCELAGKNFYTEAEVERAFLSFIASRKPEFFSDGLTELALRWRKCVSSNGSYFNKS